MITADSAESRPTVVRLSTPRPPSVAHVDSVTPLQSLHRLVARMGVLATNSAALLSYSDSGTARLIPDGIAYDDAGMGDIFIVRRPDGPDGERWVLFGGDWDLFGEIDLDEDANAFFRAGERGPGVPLAQIHQVVRLWTEAAAAETAAEIPDQERRSYLYPFGLYARTSAGEVRLFGERPDRLVLVRAEPEPAERRRRAVPVTAGPVAYARGGPGAGEGLAGRVAGGGRAGWARGRTRSDGCAPAEDRSVRPSAVGG